MKTYLPVAWRGTLMVLCLLWACLAGWSWDSSLRIIKMATPPNINGQTEDWAGNTTGHSITGKSGPCATVRLSYDATSLYMLYEVQSPTQGANNTTVFQELMKGGDAVGLCLGPINGAGVNQRLVIAKVNGKATVVLIRPQSVVKKPYTYRSPAGASPMDEVVDITDARAVIRPVTGGYIAEVAVPWTALGVNPTDNASFPCDAQVIFANPAGTTNIASYWWCSTGSGPTCVMDLPTEAKLYPEQWAKAFFISANAGTRVGRPVVLDDPFSPPGTPITFTLPRACTMSLNIVDESGWIVRELVRCTPMSAGRTTVYWDGRDRNGLLCTPGKYSYNLGTFDMMTKYVATIGNSGRPPYVTADGKGSFGGVHSGPTALAADAGGVYLINSGEEGLPAGRKVTPKGDMIWSTSLGVFGGCSAVTVDGTSVYLVILNSDGKNPFLRRQDATTGAVQPIGGAQTVALGNVAIDGIAVVNDKLYYSVKAENHLGVVDLKTGQVIKSLDIATPSGLFAADAAQLLVCSGTTVKLLDVTTGVSTDALIGLKAPRAITRDGAGNYYVSDLGDSQQILKYSKDWKLLLTIGLRGGRTFPMPKYDPLVFQNIIALAVDAEQNLWCLEKSPLRRYIKLTTEGKWIRDFYGPTPYASIIVDLDDPTSVYYEAERWDGCFYAKARINAAAFAKDPNSIDGCKIEGLYYMSQNGTDKNAKPDLMNGSGGPMQDSSGYGRGLVFTGPNGIRYFWRGGNIRSGLWLWKTDHWQACSTVRSNTWQENNIANWADANDDGLVQDGEYETKITPDNRWVWIDRDLTLYGLRGKWTPKSIDANGVPHYQDGVYTPYLPATVPTADSAFYFPSYCYDTFFSKGDDGAIYFTANCGIQQGRGFWDRCSENRIIKVKDGKVQWLVGHHNAQHLQPGDSDMLMNMVGAIDGVMLASEVDSNIMAYTSDGLSLGYICGLGGESTTIGIENVSANLFVKDPKTGKRLVYITNSEDIRVLELTGVFGNEITRIQGTVALTAPAFFGNDAPGHMTIPYQSWPSLLGTWYETVDGYSWEWDMKTSAAVISKDNSVLGEIRLRRDAGALCVFADILDTTPFDSKEKYDTPAATFGHEDGVEILLGSGLNVNRAAPQVGDTRLYLTATRNTDGTFVGKAYAYKPASAPVPADAGMRTMNNNGEYEGDAPKTAIDAQHGFVAIPGAQIAVTKRPDGHGYSLEAEIPLAIMPELCTQTPVTFMRNDNKSHTDTRWDFTANTPLKFNAAIYLGEGKGVAQRYSWKKDEQSVVDPISMNVAGWGMANDAIAINWTNVVGATGYHIYRSNLQDPATAKSLRSATLTSPTFDYVGEGDWYYWLAAVTAEGEGQWFGPIKAVSGGVSFAPYEHILPYTAKTLTPAFAIPVRAGTGIAVNIASSATTMTVTAPVPGLTIRTQKISNLVWAVFITADPTFAPGSTATINLRSNTAETITLTVKGASVWTDAYQVRGVSQVTKSNAAQIDIDSTKCADAAAGQPVTTLKLGGTGVLVENSVGRHGYIIPNWAGKQLVRKVLAPFVDNFKDNPFTSTGYSSPDFVIDKVSGGGNNSVVREGNATGSKGTFNFCTDDEQGVHMLTLIRTTRFGDCAAMRYTVYDPATDRTWLLADAASSVGASDRGAVQFKFIKGVDVTVTQTETFWDSYCLANISAAFFD